MIWLIGIFVGVIILYLKIMVIGSTIVFLGTLVRNVLLMVNCTIVSLIVLVRNGFNFRRTYEEIGYAWRPFRIRN
jgi:hypothetical protein